MTSTPIMHIDISIKFGGAQTRVMRTLQEIKQKREVCAVVLTGSPMHRRLEALGLDHIALPHGRGNPLLLFKIVAHIRRGKIGVVDSHNPASHLWGQLAAWIARVPVRIVTVHSIYRGENTDSPGKEWRNETILKLVGALGIHCIHVAPRICAYLHRLGFAPDRMTHIGNAVDAIDPPEPNGIGFRQEFGWSNEDFVVIVPASLIAVKGHRFLIDAIDYLRDVTPNLKCVFMGDGPEKDALSSHIEGLKLTERIRFLGFRDDAVGCLAQSNLMCLPSLSEGLPYSLLEAVSVRVPLLVSDLDAYRGVLEHGETGRLHPPGDVHQLSQELFWCVSHVDELRTQAHSAFTALRDQMSTDNFIEKTLALYDAVEK